MNVTIRKGIRCLGIFIGILVLLLLLVLAILIPWRERDTFYQDRIEQLSDQLQRFNGLIATIPVLEQRIASLHGNKELDAYYINATDASAGGISLQRQVEEFVRAANVSLSSVQVLPPEDQPSATKIGVRLRFGCATDELWKLLYDIESSKPFLVISTLTIRMMRQGPRRSYPGGAVDTTPELNINMDVYGYIKRVSS